MQVAIMMKGDWNMGKTVEELFRESPQGGNVSIKSPIDSVKPDSMKSCHTTLLQSCEMKKPYKTLIL